VRNPDKQSKKRFRFLNDPTYEWVKILVGAKNFGSGSSRSMLLGRSYDYGFKVCSIPVFLQIFLKIMFLNIGVLPVQVSAPFLEKNIYCH